MRISKPVWPKRLFKKINKMQERAEQRSRCRQEKPSGTAGPTPPPNFSFTRGQQAFRGCTRGGVRGSATPGMSWSWTFPGGATHTTSGSWSEGWTGGCQNGEGDANQAAHDAANAAHQAAHDAANTAHQAAHDAAKEAHNA